MSLSEVEYSRIRPQPVQVRLQVCSGSSCKHRGELLRPTQLMADDVGRDLRCERERKSHKSEDSNKRRWCVNDPAPFSVFVSLNRLEAAVRICGTLHETSKG